MKNAPLYIFWSGLKFVSLLRLCFSVGDSDTDLTKSFHSKAHTLWVAVTYWSYLVHVSSLFLSQQLSFFKNHSTFTSWNCYFSQEIAKPFLYHGMSWQYVPFTFLLRSNLEIWQQWAGGEITEWGSILSSSLSSSNLSLKTFRNSMENNFEISKHFFFHDSTYLTLTLKATQNYVETC